MATVQQFCETIDVNLSTGPDMIDITDRLSAYVSRCRIVDGTVSAFMVGSTGSLTTIEYEPGVVADLKEAINRLAPPDLPYAHELAWHDGNGHSHVRASLLGLVIAFLGGSGGIRHLDAVVSTDVCDGALSCTFNQDIDAGQSGIISRGSYFTIYS